MARRCILDKDDVRKMGLRMMVDTGAFMLAINENIQAILQLPFLESRTAQTADGRVYEYDVVGPVCETSDLFAADRPLPELKNGDLVAILSAGAYGAVMASDYNARPAAAEVLVSGEHWGIVRPRETYADLIAKDRIPDWLAD